MTATQLRQNIYQVLDKVARTGTPVSVERNGTIINLVPQKKYKKDQLSVFDNLVKRDGIKGDPEDLVHIDWSKYWKPFL